MNNPKNMPSEKWKYRKLNEIASRITEKNGERTDNVLTISAQHGLVSQTEYFNKSVASKNLSGYYYLTKGDFAYNKSYSEGYPFGAIKQLESYDQGVVSTLYICFRLSSPFVDRAFYKQYFESGLWNSEVRNIAQEGGRSHGLLNVGVKEFFEILVPVPPLAEQQKIASILSSVDGAIEKTAAIIGQTEKIKRGLIQQLLTKGIGHTKFKKTEIGQIPEEWSISRLEDVTTRIGDGIHATPKYDSHGEIPFVNGNNIKNRELYIPIDNKRINEDEYNNYKQYLNERTIFLSINGTIGNLGFYNGEKVLLGKSIAYINPSQKLLREYLFYCLESHKVQNFFLRELTGTTIKNLSLKTIRDTLIPVPTIDEQKRISSILINFDKKADVHKEELAKLLKLKQGLMQSLLTGKVRVKVDEAEVTQV